MGISVSVGGCLTRKNLDYEKGTMAASVRTSDNNMTN